MKIFDLVTFILIIIGGLNWGLMGLFHFNLVTFSFDALPWLARPIYILVGVSALYHAAAFKAIHQRWRSRANRTT